MAENQKLTIKNARLSYVTLFEPRAVVEGGPLFYSVSVIIPKDSKETINEFNKAVKKIIDEQKWSSSAKKSADLALRDGDDERPDDAAYRNCYFINAKSNKKPRVVDRAIQDIDDPDKIYSGCYGNVLISLYPFDKGGNKGVGVGLRAVQFVADGEPLGSVVSDDEFENFEEAIDEDFI